MIRSLIGTLDQMIQSILEFLGSIAFAITGISEAARKKYDILGCFICGSAVAIGGGTIRDLLLGVPVFWLTSPSYLIATTLGLVMSSRKSGIVKGSTIIFDTIGLASFSIMGLEKTLLLGYPWWVAVGMGTITGSAGGLVRDLLLNEEPCLLRKDLYATSSILGGVVYIILYNLIGITIITELISFLSIIIMRYLALKYKLNLPSIRKQQTYE